MKVNGIKIWKMDLGNLYSKMETFMRVILKMENDKVRENWYGKMGVFLKGNF